MGRDILIYVDNRQGSDNNDGRAPGPRDPSTGSGAVATADMAFSLLPPYWEGRAEITFATTLLPYPIITSAVSLGMPIGPRAKPLVIRGGYTNEVPNLTATISSTFLNRVDTEVSIPTDQTLGAVLTRVTNQSGGFPPAGTGISIRGNEDVRRSGFPQIHSSILLQRPMGRLVGGDALAVQRPAVTLAPAETLTLTSHDGRSPNLTLIGIRIAPAQGKGLALTNVRAQCDTCEFLLVRAIGSETNPVILHVHTNARIQGGIENADLSPNLPRGRGEAGVYIHSNDPLNIVWAIRGGILGGHLTFRDVTVQASQGGVFVPTSLEAYRAPIRILAGGAALAEKEGWGTLSNKARIRDVQGPEGDGLRVSNGGSLNSPRGPINLDIYRCGRDGIRLETASTASFGRPGEDAGLVTTIAKNLGFGMSIRNGSRALVGRDAAGSLTVPPLSGILGDCTLDGTEPHQAIRWSELVVRDRRNDRMSHVGINYAPPA